MVVSGNGWYDEVRDCSCQTILEREENMGEHYEAVAPEVQDHLKQLVELHKAAE